ncbi:MAG: hydroxymethylglutaryl-CoA lyase [Syntrophobacteraceae bacterium]|nr:hydroxymethylglutaryl-CoA lyase [Syntrophobacteraceae bacterium]
MNIPESITIVEVGPRDGLQSEPRLVSTDKKIELIERLSDAGLKRIEITSFVSPKAVPQLSDSEEVAARLQRRPGARYCALTPNYRGLERAIRAGIDEIALFVSASETHNQKNVRMSISRSLGAFRQIGETALSRGMHMRGYVATAFGCEYEGRVSLDQVEKIVVEYIAMGVQEISLGDTTGMANPVAVGDMVRRLKPILGNTGLALHFHDTRGTGVANALAAIEEGAVIFDCSIGGLGGCPASRTASGNIATEDLVGMVHEMGISTGIDLEALIECARYAGEITGRNLPGHLVSAGKVNWQRQK